VIKKMADSIGCLAIAFMAAFFASWILLGFGMMSDLQDERTRAPLWQSAALVMAITFGPATAIAVFAAARPHRPKVMLVGLTAGLFLYVAFGVFWWFRF